MIDGHRHSTAFHLGQLRHLYAQMVTGGVTDTAEAARGLLGPAIAHFELEARVEAEAEATANALPTSDPAPK
jgi:hypothetical protein